MILVALVALASHLTGPIATYTLDVDFDDGTLVNVNHDFPNSDQLQLDSVATPFAFIWVAASARGTVVKIDTNTGAILGEFRSTPSSQGNGNPSRTTVDNDGSVWVANRANVSGGFGTVLHIGLEENNQCEDRNSNNVIDTSTGFGDIRAWANDSGTRSVATADDECIVHYTRVNSTGTRHVSVDANNDVWVSGSGTSNFDLLKGGRYDVPVSGGIIRSEISVGFGGYGGLIDGNGVIWSARSLLRWDVVNPLTGPNGDPAGFDIGPPTVATNWAGQGSPDSYGLCIDPFGNVWNTQLSGNLIHKYSPSGVHLGAFSHGNNNAQGCVADGNGDIWVAHSLFGATTVGHLLNNGTHVGNVSLPGGTGPTGVAVDAAGKVWAANISSDNVSRIDPALGPIGGGGVPIGGVDLTVGLGAGAGPYNYSDMTGSTLIAPPNSGTWTVTQDSGIPGVEWGVITWNDEPQGAVPSDSSLTVEARSSTDNATWSAWEAVSYGSDLTVPDGQYLQVRVSFVRATTGESPILSDLTIQAIPVMEATKDASVAVDVYGDGGASEGDTLLYTVVLTNTGAPANDVFYDDTPDPSSALVAGSVTTTQGTIPVGNGAGDTSVQVDVGTIGFGGSVTITYQVLLDDPLHDLVLQNGIVNQGTASGSNFPDLPTDDPTTPALDDPTIVPVSDICQGVTASTGCKVNGGLPGLCRGTPGADVIIGTSGKDVILGRGGDDNLVGLEGHDLLCGQGGEDFLEGNQGRDRIDGGGGADILRGNGGRDLLTGRGGNDDLFGDEARDVLDGGKGNDDYLDGGLASDKCTDPDGATMIRCGRSCGLGFELALVLAPLLWLSGRRRGRTA